MSGDRDRMETRFGRGLQLIGISGFYHARIGPRSNCGRGRNPWGRAEDLARFGLSPSFGFKRPSERQSSNNVNRKAGILVGFDSILRADLTGSSFTTKHMIVKREFVIPMTADAC